MAGEAATGTGGAVSAGFSLISTYMEVQARKEFGRIARIRGEQQRVRAEFAAVEAERRGGAAIAISQRAAAEDRRQGELVASRALAVAASNGGGVNDPTMIRVIANARGEAAVRAANDLYEGTARARALRLDAAMGRMQGFELEAEGAATQQGYALAQAGSIAKGAESLYSKYGMSGPRGDAALIGDQVPGQYSTSNVQYGG